MIRDAMFEDAVAIRDIYNPYIENTIITFEEELLSSEDMAVRIQKTQAENLPWLVFVENQQILGYAYANLWKSRRSYRHSVESSVYLPEAAQGKGIGTKLYTELLAQLRALDYHAVIGGISLPNAASVALHEKVGFEKVAHFKEVGLKFNRWIDVGYWEIVFDAE